MTLRAIMMMSLVSSALVAGGCDTGMEDSLSIQGSMVGSVVPDAADAVVLWLKDYNGEGTYKTGEGTAMNGTFTVSLPHPPPREADVVPGLAVGWIALYEPGYEIPDGPVASEVADPILGISARFAIVYKAEDGSGNAAFPWAASFPAGYSCAYCTQGIPDGYEPVPCTGFEVDALSGGGSSYEWCTWLPRTE
jgi:hypothetical protein